jgi:hypothetical protein
MRSVPPPPVIVTWPAGFVAVMTMPFVRTNSVFGGIAGEQPTSNQKNKAPRHIFITSPFEKMG